MTVFFEKNGGRESVDQKINAKAKAAEARQRYERADAGYRLVMRTIIRPGNYVISHQNHVELAVAYEALKAG